MATEQGKIVLDPIYGIIQLDALAVKIIDTDCFQRLRYIKQLSFADFVYPGATHTRFVHSIGVYHLACEMIKVIVAQNLDDSIRLTEDDKMCIRVAALCHDLGHGPFSHGYEEILKDVKKCELKHETISQVLVKKILEDMSEFKDGKKSDCIQLIQALIKGDFDKYKQDKSKSKKKYMFQIVSNKTSGVDVDKWDYFKRDARACGVPETFQYDRALSVARVVQTDNGEYELGFRDDDGFSFYNMFNTRFTMYRKVYYHKVADAVGLMIKDIFQLVDKGNNDQKNPFDDANPYVDSVKIDIFPIETVNKGKQLNPEEVYLPPLGEDVSSRSSTFDKSERFPQDQRYLKVDKYLTLRNDVLLKIGDSKVHQYKEARDLIQRLQNRKLYKLVDVIKTSESTTTETQQRSKEVQDQLKKKLDECEDFKYDVEILVRKFNYGQNGDNPVTNMYFYDKESTKEISLDGTDRGTQNASESTTTETQQRSKEEKKLNYGQNHDDPVNKAADKVCLIGKPKTKDSVSFVLPSVFEEHDVRVYEKFSAKGIPETTATSYICQIRTIIEKIRDDYMTGRNTRSQETVKAPEKGTT